MNVKITLPVVGLLRRLRLTCHRIASALERENKGSVQLLQSVQKEEERKVRRGRSGG